MKKKILFFTGTRADYGLLSPLIRVFWDDSSYETKILATGTHLEPQFGNSINEITGDGFTVDFKVPLNQKSDSQLDVCASAGLGVQKFSEVLQHYKPDLCFVLGDRFEALAFAFAAHVHHSLIAHIHGGEITEGAIDDSFRHAITKLSYLHLTTAEEHQNRVIQLGESPERVFNVGALGVDNAIALKKLTRSDLEIELKIKLNQRVFLITFHPETLSIQSSDDQMDQLSLAVEAIQSEFSGECSFVFTMPNADPGYEPIRRRILALVEKHPQTVSAFATLGKLKYLSLMALSDVVVGNSSSGLIEAPALNVPTLNIGDRQKGRLTSKSVVHSVCESSAITKLWKSLILQGKSKVLDSKFGHGDAAAKIKKAVDLALMQKPLRKAFYDQPR